MSERLFALAIAGGRGERLKPITDSVPKPMVPLRGRPMISYQVEWMRGQGVTDVVFLCGYLGERIRDYFGDGSGHGVRAHYSFEDEPLGRGGAVRKGMALVPPDAETVLVTNGDNVTDQPLSEMFHLHRAKRALVTMMLAPYPSQYGVVETDERNIVTRFVEKGKLPFWINAGIYLFDRSLETALPQVGDHETSMFQDLSVRGRIAGLRSEARWLTVDSPKDIKTCEEALDSMRRPGPATRSVLPRLAI
jgi:NDP-sugar pyrophosphorylase family protein